MIVEVRSLDVTVDDATILNGIDLQVRCGEFVALVGPNGAGKSTLLAALAGDLAPTRGTVVVNGSQIGSLRPIALARLRSVLPQHTKTLFSFDAASVVAMGRHPHANTDDDEAAVRHALERVGVLHLAHRSFPTLSGGEQTLVNLARVLAQQTPLVLLDEPTAALDLGHQELVCTIAGELAAEGRAVVVVLHELNLAARYAHRVVVLDRGRIVADADPGEAFTARRLSALYGHPVAVVDHPFLPGRPLILPTQTAVDHVPTDPAASHHALTEMVAAVPAPTSRKKAILVTTATQAPAKDPHRDGGFDPQPDVQRLTHAELARTLVHLGGRATLSTIAVDPAGYPFGSLVTYLADATGSPWILISTMAEHTRNAARDPRAAVLISEEAPAGIDPLALARATLIGNLVRDQPDDELRTAFLQRHPGSRAYIDFPDFQWWRLDIAALRYVGGFGRMSWVDADHYLAASPDPIAEHAESIVAHMNTDHLDTQSELLRYFLHRPDITRAQMTSVDRLGCDFDTTSPTGNLPLRLPFTNPASTPAAVRTAIVEMLHVARSAEAQ